MGYVVWRGVEVCGKVGKNYLDKAFRYDRVGCEEWVVGGCGVVGVSDGRLRRDG